MGRSVGVAAYLVAMVIIIVGADFLVFRNQFWPRLAFNVGVVLVFGAVYFRFIQKD